MHKYFICYETVSKWNGTPVLHNMYHYMSGLSETNIEELRKSLRECNSSTVSITFLNFIRVESTE